MLILGIILLIAAVGVLLLAFGCAQVAHWADLDMDEHETLADCLHRAARLDDARIAESKTMVAKTMSGVVQSGASTRDAEMQDNTEPAAAQKGER